jgi:AraC-like DNA-binding protein
MSAGFPVSPYEIGILSPPYRAVIPSHSGALATPRQENIRDGSLIVFRLVDPTYDLDWVKRTIWLARRQYLSMPLVVHLPDGIVERDMPLVQALWQLGVSGVFFRKCAIYRDLAPQMTAPPDHAAKVREWLSLRLPNLGHASLLLLGQILGQELRGGPRAKLARTERKLLSYGKKELSDLHLPPPRSWGKLARALRAALAIQADPGASFSCIAAHCGYSEQASLSNQVKATFGMRPGRIRYTLGWEWLMERWVIQECPTNKEGLRASDDPRDVL